MSMRLTLFAAAALALVCNAAAFDEADALFGKVRELCGKAFAGRLVTTDTRDADMAGKPLVMHVAECDGDRIAIPFQVGDDRSRTWLVTRTDKGLRLKHRHRHADGTDDKVTLYGGDTATAGTPTRQEFPVDAESQAMFRANGLDVSVTNVWALELVPGAMFAYELRREGRFFRVEFDLTKPVATPPPPWGATE